MPAYYPVYLDLRGQNCIVIGGNSTSEDKTRRLIEYGATVTVISPSAKPTASFPPGVVGV